jgi:hypothetical protein
MEFTDHKSPANNLQTTTPPSSLTRLLSSPPSHLIFCCTQPSVHRIASGDDCDRARFFLGLLRRASL